MSMYFRFFAKLKRQHRHCFWLHCLWLDSRFRLLLAQSYSFCWLKYKTLKTFQYTAEHHSAFNDVIKTIKSRFLDSKMLLDIRFREMEIFIELHSHVKQILIELWNYAKRWMMRSRGGIHQRSYTEQTWQFFAEYDWIVRIFENSIPQHLDTNMS